MLRLSRRIVSAEREGNTALLGLKEQDWALLSPYLHSIEFKPRQRLEAVNRKTAEIYFIESGLISVIAVGRGSRAYLAEVALIGNEGIIGIFALLGVERSPYEAMALSAGRAQRIASEDLRRLLDESPSLRTSLEKYIHSFLSQVAQTALANATAALDQRVARWLLMAHERVGPELDMTHDAISLVLGTRRAGVTITLNRMKFEELIANERGRITILDRAGLAAVANGFWIPIKQPDGDGGQ